MNDKYGKLKPNSDKQFSELLHFIDKENQREYEYARFSKWIEFCMIIVLISVGSFVIVYIGEKLPENLGFLLASIPSILALIGYKGFRNLCDKRTRNNSSIS